MLVPQTQYDPRRDRLQPRAQGYISCLQPAFTIKSASLSWSLRLWALYNSHGHSDCGPCPTFTGTVDLVQQSRSLRLWALYNSHGHSDCGPRTTVMVTQIVGLVLQSWSLVMVTHIVGLVLQSWSLTLWALYNSHSP